MAPTNWDGGRLWDRQDSARELIEILEGELIAGRFDRQLRLTMCAWAGRVVHLDPTGGAARLIAAAEAFADGRCGYARLLAEAVALSGRHQPGGHTPSDHARHAAGPVAFDPAACARKFDAAYWALGSCQGASPGAGWYDEDRAQGAVMKDVFGNPFRPVAFDPDWRTAAAVALARLMYDARDFAHLPILADALEDAGCTDPDVLAHCRGPGPHVRGCWVVDLVLGKA